MRLLLALSLVLATTADLAAAPSEPGACDARMNRLAAHLRELAPNNVMPLLHEHKLARGSGGKALDRRGWLITVPARGKPALDTLRPSTGSLAEQIASALGELTERELAGAKTAPIYLAVEEGAPRAQLTNAVKVARSSGLRGELRRLVDEGPPSIDAAETALLSRPSVRQLRAKLVGASFVDRAAILSGAMMKAIPPCAPILKQLGPYHQDLTKLPDAARKCRCRIADIDVFEFALLTSFKAFDRRVGWLPERE